MVSLGRHGSIRADLLSLAPPPATAPCFSRASVGFFLSFSFLRYSRLCSAFLLRTSALARSSSSRKDENAPRLATRRTASRNSSSSITADSTATLDQGRRHAESRRDTPRPSPHRIGCGRARALLCRLARGRAAAGCARSRALESTMGLWSVKCCEMRYGAIHKGDATETFVTGFNKPLTARDNSELHAPSHAQLAAWRLRRHRPWHPRPPADTGCAVCGCSH